MNYQKSKTIEIKRSQINFAPYNPKKHSKKEVDQIKKNIKKVAFLGGIVWNEKTGNLINGHKRLMALDLINKYDTTNDYLIKVESVNVSEKIEKEQNIFMSVSNTAIDFEMIGDFIEEIDYLDAGLTDEDLIYIPQKEIEQNYSNTGEFSQQSNIDNRDIPLHQDNAINSPKTELKEDKSYTNKKTEPNNLLNIMFTSVEKKKAFLSLLGIDNQLTDFVTGEPIEQLLNI